MTLGENTLSLTIATGSLVLVNDYF